MERCGNLRNIVLTIKLKNVRPNFLNVRNEHLLQHWKEHRIQSMVQSERSEIIRQIFTFNYSQLPYISRISEGLIIRRALWLNAPTPNQLHMLALIQRKSALLCTFRTMWENLYFAYIYLCFRFLGCLILMTKNRPLKKMK